MGRSNSSGCMGFTAALLSKTGTDISAQLIRMLRTASSATGDSYGIATHDNAEYHFTTESASVHGSDILLGHKLIMIRPNDPPQPVNQHGYSLTFNGRLWSPQGASDLVEAANILGWVPEDGIERLIDDYDGSYAITVAEEERILCGRDQVGVVPLYIGESASLLGVASNKRMLHGIGIDARSLPPGCIATMTKGGVQTRSIRTLSHPQTRKITIEEAVNELDTLLLGAVEARSNGVHSASLGFSGGIDSSLLAYYLDRCGVKVDLICVGLIGSAFEEAEESAESLDLPIRLESHSLKDVEESISYVLDSVEDPDPMKIGVALPLMWAAKSAIKHGNRIFYSGCGSDELFGGYFKYIKKYTEFGERIKDIMYYDVAASHDVNYERDYKVCANIGVELRLPFADLRLIEFGLALPIEYKFSRDGSVRKLLLRELARSKGLSECVASRRKKAIQYSTGVSTALRNLAKKEGITLKRYLTDFFARAREGCPA
jgi:asparagine synthase (glutamine-hydrolysing)